METSRSEKKTISNRPYIISIVCFIILIMYFILPFTGSVFIYVKWNSPSIQKIINQVLSIMTGYLSSNYYLMVSHLTLTIIGVIVIPLIIMMKLWTMKRNVITICKFLCLLQIALFYSHFSLLDELIYKYSFLKDTLIYIYSGTLLFLISAFLYSKRME